ncbi:MULTISPECIES: helix-turn-helix domain-containing protein [Stenotrophomonas]|uniref:AraC family transcriptional regulator with amidase-like domain n=1 Tax=Stenotrophomonas rhizophila TaxID=216778 RepID=A0A498CIJ3_9GAMM|nr:MULTISPECIES: helix-turn-helix domain-containing protein [Stenotrophomonas]KAB7632279.1 helix-turn-helix domain-containing protein [Stenotrophomonas rhizophila]MBU2047891.1 helix-turn-helix domain-containing protein [Gammaproteobacteria bacterium]RLK56210.1 AraC family transcriptional regulator with amidase-like domain [Stenotrophomonas rhizophila]
MDAPRNTLQPDRRPDTPTLMEVAVVEFPGSLRAAAPVLSELAQRCNRTVAAGRRTGPRMLVTRWTMSARGMQRVAGAELFGEALPAIIVVPGSESSWTMAPPDERLLAWVRECHDGCSLLAGCDEGGLLLAAAGVLAGRSVSVPDPARCPALRTMVPSWLPSERTLVDDGDLLTAAGQEAWKYLSLRLLARVYGQGVMNTVIQQLQLVIPRTELDDLERFSPNFAHGDRCILKAQRWLHGIAARGVGLDDICAQAGLEPRTLQRRFLKATGMRPIEYCQRLRIAKAQLLLQAGGVVDEVACAVGYSDQSAFRRLFLRIVGLTPARYRRQLAAQQREHAAVRPVGRGVEAIRSVA